MLGSRGDNTFGSIRLSVHLSVHPSLHLSIRLSLQDVIFLLARSGR